MLKIAAEREDELLQEVRTLCFIQKVETCYIFRKIRVI